jgi:hypothetical protein
VPGIDVGDVLVEVVEENRGLQKTIGLPIVTATAVEIAAVSLAPMTKGSLESAWETPILVGRTAEARRMLKTETQLAVQLTQMTCSWRAGSQ